MIDQELKVKKKSAKKTDSKKTPGARVPKAVVEPAKPKASRVAKSAKKNSAPKLELKQGACVLYVTQEAMLGENANMAKARTEGQPAKVIMISEARLVLQFAPIGGGLPGFVANVSENSIKLIEEKEYNSIVEARMAAIKAAEEEATRKRFAAYMTPHLPLMERDVWDLRSRWGLQTNYNFINRGRIDINNTTGEWTFANGNQNDYAACCSLTRTTADLKVFIPDLWLTYYGYNHEDLQRWIDFLTACGHGFNARLLPAAPMENFSRIESSDRDEDGSRLIMNRTMLVHPVILKAGSAHETYMRFITLRYMYNRAYWNIPTLAMQLKEALGDRITPWQALMLAHLNAGYNSYYALFGGYGTGYRGTNINVIMPTANNLPTRIAARAGDHGMNGSFASSVVPLTTLTGIQEGFRTKNFEQIYTLASPYFSR
ncbi:MAG TPA: hypothetical protein VGE06_00630 [Flavisolibacter sp.]